MVAIVLIIRMVMKVKNDDDSSDNESWSSYDNLPEEDFQKKEEGACSENVSVLYILFVG